MKGLPRLAPLPLGVRVMLARGGEPGGGGGIIDAAPSCWALLDDDMLDCVRSLFLAVVHKGSVVKIVHGDDVTT